MAPGFYYLQVRAIGYLSINYSTLQITEDAQGNHRQLQLTRAAMITGTITDSDGLPAPQAIISVLTARPVQPGDANGSGVRLLPDGQTALISGDDLSADDRGEYRYTNLLPGTYYVLVKTRLNPRDLATYYPGAAEVAGARPISLRAGQVARADLRMSEGAGARVSGRASLAPGKMVPPGSYLTVQLSMPSASMTYTSVPWSHSPVSFELRGVSPGTYSVSAIISGPGELPWAVRPNLYGAVARVVVAEQDINNLDITLQELPPISGTVTFGAGCAPTSVQIGAASAAVYAAADGSFQLKGMRLQNADYRKQHASDQPMATVAEGANQPLSLTLPR